MKFLGYTTAILITLTIEMVYAGYALSVLWSWFIVPVFDAPTLTIPTAIGISMVVTFLTHQSKADKGEETMVEILSKGIVMALVKPTFALAFGWVVTLFLTK